MDKPKNSQIQCIEVIHFSEKEDESLDVNSEKNSSDRCSKQEKSHKKTAKKKKLQTPTERNL